MIFYEALFFSALPSLSLKIVDMYLRRRETVDSVGKPPVRTRTGPPLFWGGGFPLVGPPPPTPSPPIYIYVLYEKKYTMIIMSCHTYISVSIYFLHL